MKVYIKKKEAGFFLGEKGEIRMFVPQISPVPDYVQLIACIGIMLEMEDKKFINYVCKRWAKIISEEIKND